MNVRVIISAAMMTEGAFRASGSAQHRATSGFAHRVWSLLWLVVALCVAANPAGAAGWAGVEHVVVIGVDGLSSPGVETAKAPVLRGLMTRGAYTLEARGVLPTSSSSNWASMITGASPERHGVTSNDWQRDDHTITPWDQGPEKIYPTIFSRLRAVRPDAGIVVIHHWDDFARLAERSACDVFTHAKSAEAATQATVEAIEKLKPVLTFVHLDHVDGAGHAAGWETPAYLEAVAIADGQIGRILEALRSAGMLERTLVLIVSDHGGVGKSHGGETMAELQIPWIVAGPGVAAGRRIEVAVQTMYTAATVAAALGFSLAPSATGRAVVEALSSTAEGAGIGRAVRFVARPRMTPRGGRFVDTMPEVTLSSDEPEADIRFTLDGSEPSKDSPVYSGPLRVSKAQTVRAAVFVGTARSELTSAEFRLVRSEAGRGATYRVFAGRFETVGQLTGLVPLKVGVSPEIDFEDLRVPVQTFGATFDAEFEAPVAGSYRFWTESDDGSGLSVNGKPVVSNDGEHGPRLRGGSVELAAGKHRIEVRYFNAGGSGALKVFFALPGGRRQALDHGSIRPVTLPDPIPGTGTAK